MSIVLDCPGCGKRFEIDEAHSGKKSKCKQCGSIFRIPGLKKNASDLPPASGRRPAPAVPPPVWDAVLDDEPRT